MLVGYVTACVQDLLHVYRWMYCMLLKLLRMLTGIIKAPCMFTRKACALAAPIDMRCIYQVIGCI